MASYSVRWGKKSENFPSYEAAWAWADRHPGSQVSRTIPGGRRCEIDRKGNPIPNTQRTSGAKHP